MKSDTIRIENINVYVSGNRILIEYDLYGPKDEQYEVSLLLKRENINTYRYIPNNAVGDIGKGNFAGNRRQIIWDFLKEFPQKLSGKDFYFVVNAKVISSGISPLIWIGGGVAILSSGAAYYFLTKKKEETKTVTLPDAPDRP
jgi:hypothetical protein